MFKALGWFLLLSVLVVWAVLVSAYAILRTLFELGAAAIDR